MTVKSMGAEARLKLVKKCIFGAIIASVICISYLGWSLLRIEILDSGDDVVRGFPYPDKWLLEGIERLISGQEHRVIGPAGAYYKTRGIFRGMFFLGVVVVLSGVIAYLVILQAIKKRQLLSGSCKGCG